MCEIGFAVQYCKREVLLVRLPKYDSLGTAELGLGRCSESIAVRCWSQSRQVGESVQPRDSRLKVTLELLGRFVEGFVLVHVSG